MKRIRLTVAYDGTNYCGWQVQPNGISVQQVLDESLSRLLKTRVHTVGASRTDAGVHALGQVAVFDTEARMPAEKYALAFKYVSSGRHTDSGFPGSKTGFPSTVCTDREDV